MKYYSLNEILKCNADYNIIYGERSNGKTTSVLLYAIDEYVNSNYKNKFGVLRRWEEDFKKQKANDLFNATVKELNYVEKATKGEYNSISFYSSKWYFVKVDENGEVIKKRDDCFAYAFGINAEEHYKSISFPDITTILFDEFITRGYYLPDEFIKFQNVLSTIIRTRDNVKIFMCANTINKFCPYFNEMGLINIRKQKEGSIDLYEYGDSGLRVACEYTAVVGKKKKSNKYFAFNNPKLQMITNGKWEINIYPHLPEKYKPKEVLFKFFIKFDEYILECDLVYTKYPFIFIHLKTTPIKYDEIIYCMETSPNPNILYDIYKPTDRRTQLIAYLFKNKKVFYQSNDIGEIVNNYIKETSGTML